MISIAMIDQQGKPSTVSLDAHIERKEANSKAFACAVRAQFQNWRQGTVKVKTRGELAFSNKKPWRQKGTGRARVSSIRSPLWRKGGVIFGPQPRVRTLDMNTKQKRVVFNNLLFATIEKNALFGTDFNVSGKPNTKAALNALKSMGLDTKKVVLFLPFNDELTYASFRNLPNVSIVLFDQPDVYHLSNGDCWVVLKKDMDHFKQMVEQWN